MSKLPEWPKRPAPDNYCLDESGDRERFLCDVDTFYRACASFWEARCRLAVKILEDVNMGRYADADGIYRELESLPVVIDYVCDHGLCVIGELPEESA